jgi:hypothetical protein
VVADLWKVFPPLLPLPSTSPLLERLRVADLSCVSCCETVAVATAERGLEEMGEEEGDEEEGEEERDGESVTVAAMRESVLICC